MVFKGTDRHSAEDVNRIFDEIGAQYNASTGEEITLFYAAVLPEYLPPAFELLSDIMRPALRDADFEMEKQVILEEIGMYDDQPSYVAYDNGMQRHFAGHSLGQTVLGSRDTVGALTAEQMRAYHRDRYAAGNVVLAVAGRVAWDDVVALAERHCGAWPGGQPPRALTEPQSQPNTLWIARPQLQQEQVVLFAPAPSATDRLRYAAELLTVIVGDDHNSRLYWELVDPGRADIAEVNLHEFEGCGAYLTFLTGEPEQTADNLAHVAAVFESLNRDGVTADELELAKTKVATRLVLRGERPMGRLSLLGHDWLIRREYRSVADDLALLQSLLPRDLRELLDRYPLGITTTVGVGPLSPAAV
jgi:predicted Zn-dependent peptidase